MGGIAAQVLPLPASLPIATPTPEPRPPESRRHHRRTVYRAVAFERGEPPPTPAPPNFTVFNDCIHISRHLLALSREPEALLYPAEHIHALIHALLAQAAEAGPPGGILAEP